MGTVVTLHRLVDGPLSLDDAREERAAKVAKMAAILVDKNCFADHGDSLMVLVAARFPYFEIFALLPDARQAAEEHVVAMEMSDQ